MLNKNIKYIIRKIEAHNFKAYLVGGAVRNFLLGLEVSDFDITTNALPQDIEGIFHKTIPTGKKYGTITVIHDNSSYEVTTFRSDGTYSDGRRPDSVRFSTELIEDLKRRDFTINAICIDIDEKLIDYFNGIEDIKNKIVRCIGNPDERFTEDALRMMRAVRFMTQLKFTLDENTRLSIIKNSDLIKNISVERIREELNKILLSDKPSDGIRMIVDTGLMKQIIPEFMDTIGFNQHNPYHDKDVFEHTMEVLDSTKSKLSLRLAALFHDISKPECFTQDESGRGHFYEHEVKSSERAKLIMERLKYPNDITEDVRVLVRYHLLKSVDMKDKGVKRYINNVGIDRLENMFDLNIADIKGKSKIADTSGFERLEILREKCRNIIERKEPLSRKDLKINGRDLEALGIEKGHIYTEVLNKVLDLVLEFPERNSKEELKKYVLSLVNEQSDK